VGALTAIFAASIGLVQNDMKRVLAYSTVSQLGYMFLAVGVGAFTAGIFHLMTHAFFKALLFLSAGSVMHALSGELDIQKMGNLRKKMPLTFIAFVAGGVALAGLPGTSGFFSKDEILAQAWFGQGGSPILYGVGVLGAVLTAFYTTRLIVLIFFGPSRLDPEVESHAHESPPVMTVPLMILAVLALVGGFIGVPAVLGGSNRFGHFLEPVFHHGHGHAGHADHSLELMLMGLSVVLVFCAILTAWLIYKDGVERARGLADRMRSIHTLLFNKYWVDELYGFLVVKHLLFWCRFLAFLFDAWIVDGLVNASGATVQISSSVLARVQSGRVRTYFAWMLLGAAVVLAMVVFG
jgi:NADH-quinone oxidoreductase subunit L